MSTVAREDAAPAGSVPLPELAHPPRPRGSSGGRGTEAKPRSKRLYVLDGLRLVAALMVVSFHYVGYDNWGSSPWGKSTSAVFPTLHPAAAYGWLGVELFFLISGFVICMSCWGKTPRQFAVSRFIRLYPAYWFGILATGSVLLLRPGGTDIPASDMLTNATMFQELLGARDIDGVYWSLWVEMRFYLIFAVVAVMGLTYRRVVGFCAFWLLAAALAPHSGIGLFELMLVPKYAAFFVGGIVIYLMRRFGPNPTLWLMLGASWLIAQNQLPGLLPNAEDSTHTDLSWGVALAIVTAFYLLVLGAALDKLDFLNWRWLTVAGMMTYPLYLLHEDIGWEIIRHTSDHIAPRTLLVGLFAVMLLASYLVHRLVERPLSKWLKDWVSPPSNPKHRTPATRT